MLTTRVEEFKELTPIEWFNRNKQFLGLENPVKAAYTIFRELFENSLDACEDAQIQPKIHIEIKSLDGMYSFSIVDNGPGVPKERVPDAFGKLFFGTKYSLKQQRGALGMGGKMMLIYSYLETDRPYKIVSSTINDDTMYVFTMKVDEKYRPVYTCEAVKQSQKWHGVAIKLFSKADFQKGLNKIVTYLDLTTTICPYIQVTLTCDGKEVFRYRPITNKMPPKGKVVKHHPHGVDLRTLKSLIENVNCDNMLDFMVKAFQRVGKSTAESFLRFAKLDPRKNPRELDSKELVALVDKLKQYDKFLAPDTSCLSPITKEILIAGIKAKYSPEFITYKEKRGVFEGHPFIVECVVMLGEQAPTCIESSTFPDPFRFSNKIPLLYDKASCAMTKVVKKVPPGLYGLKDGTKIAIFLHFCSTKVPYKTPGKEYISPDYEEVNSVIENALRDCLREVRMYVSRKEKEKVELKRRSIYDIYIPLIADCLSSLTDKNPKVLNKLLYKSLGMSEEVDDLSDIMFLEEPEEV